MDRPAYPWTCFVRMRFDGVLGRVSVENAIHDMLIRHPLLRSVVKKSWRSHDWLPVDDPLVRVHWRVGKTGGPMPAAEHLDLPGDRLADLRRARRFVRRPDRAMASRLLRRRGIVLFCG